MNKRPPLPSARKFNEELQQLDADWAKRKAEIYACIADPKSTDTQTLAYWRDLKVNKEIYQHQREDLKDRIKTAVDWIKEDQKRAGTSAHINSLITPPPRHKNDPHHTWEDRRENGILGRMWHTFTYLVFAQRIGTHLFSKPAGDAIDDLNQD